MRKFNFFKQAGENDGTRRRDGDGGLCGAGCGVCGHGGAGLVAGGGMRKRSKYRPRPVLTDPVAFVVEGAAMLGEHGTYVVDWKLKNHVAMEMLFRGEAKRAHVDTLVAARNVTEALMVTLGGADVDGTLMRSGAALMDLCDRGNAGKSLVLRAPEMQAMRDLMGLHDELLDVVTVGQMERAIAYAKREINAGRAARLKEVV